MRYAREEDACLEKEAERTGTTRRRNGREDKDVRRFLSSCTRLETSTLPLFFQKTMSDRVPVELNLFDFLFPVRSSSTSSGRSMEKYSR